MSTITDTRDSETPLKQIKSLLLDTSRDVTSSRDVNITSSSDLSVGGTLSSFELLHAGLIETLLKFLTPQPSDRLVRHREYLDQTLLIELILWLVN